MFYDDNRYLQTEPRSSHMFSMQRMKVEIQSTSIDLLQCVSSRSELESSTLIPLESAVIEKLYMLVHSSQLPLQNKLVFASYSILAKYRVDAYVSDLRRKNKLLRAPFHLPVKEETEKKAQRGVPTQNPKVQMERMSQKSPVATSEFLTVRVSHCAPA